MCKRFIILSLFLPVLLMADSYLFFLELQGVAGYSHHHQALVGYSHHAAAAMQKSSVGFDYLQRLSSGKGDWGALAAQIRLSVNPDGDKLFEPQIYNLFFKYKSGLGDLWLGHNRPAFAMAAFLDTHGQLIQTLAMEGFGYERDWGFGYNRDFSWGSAAISLTSGSGMPLRFQGNHLFSARFAWGLLERDNVSIGLSASTGSLLPVMAMDEDHGIVLPWTAAALDFSHRVNQFENRLELMLGRHDQLGLAAASWRGGLLLDSDERWKLESQIAFWEKSGESGSRAGLALSWQLTPSLALRSFAYYQGHDRSVSVVLQLYYYRPLWF